MKKTLFSFYEELSNIGFDKKKAQGLVKRANSAGYDIYYAYHEDNADTWKKGWSSDEYKENDNDVKLFEATDLIQKNKPSFSFQRAQTYTAECAIFIFCPLSTMMKDENLRQLKIQNVKSKAEKFAIADYKNCIAKKDAFDKWQKLPEENKSKITLLQTEILENRNKPGSREIRKEKEKLIEDLGGNCYPLVEWQEKVIAFLTVEEYVKFKQDQAVENLLKEVAEIEAEKSPA